LVRRADGGGRVPAVEVLISTAYVRECIITPEKTRNIREALATGTSQYGMQTFDQSLYDLYSQGLISYEVALENATNPDDFKLRVSGISSTTESARDEMQTSYSAGFGR
jgi:twitching motility protein PilT